MECYAGQSPSADEIYESMGIYCANIERFSAPFIEKKESEFSRKPGIETQRDQVSINPERFRDHIPDAGLTEKSTMQVLVSWELPEGSRGC